MWTRNIRIRRIGRVVFLLAWGQCPWAEAKSSTEKLCFPFLFFRREYFFISPRGINNGETIVVCSKYEIKYRLLLRTF